MAKLQEFQLAAVRRAIDRLTAPDGSGRFLIADEVGLGKTLVARGVVDAMRGATRRGFTIVYVCSNLEIADQNRTKLWPDQGGAGKVSRLTQLAAHSAEVRRAREQDATQLFAFTPGTSFHPGTGTKYERRMILYLLARVWHKRVNRKAWRLFLAAGARDVETWLNETRFRHVKSEFRRRISVDLQEKLRRQWGTQQVAPLARRSDARGEGVGAIALSVALDQAVAAFDPSDASARRHRNRLVAALRDGLSRVALDCLDPDLIVLDEFQRFSDVLKESRDSDTIVGRLFAARDRGRGRRRVLILSATPYRMYTLRHEGEDHHTDFFNTLAFLRDETVDSPSLQRFRQQLARFRDRLIAGEWLAAGGDPELEALKRNIEAELGQVMSRTERNWFIQDAAKGVEEVPAAGASGKLPARAELYEYVRLRQFLLRQEVPDWNVTDFWKSCPSIVSFMDGRYALMRKLRQRRPRIPDDVFLRSDRLHERWPHHLKFSMFFDRVFADARDTAPGATSPVPGRQAARDKPWRFLWVRPRLTYYRDEFYGDADPRKFLVFSHWRFVPKAVAAVTSGEVERRLRRASLRSKSAPLQFRKRLSFAVFDVCFPSPSLADLISPLKLAEGEADTVGTGTLAGRAARILRSRLHQVNVRVARGRSAPLWRVVARLDAVSRHRDVVRNDLLDTRVESRAGERSEYFQQYARQYARWMDEATSSPDETLQLSKKDFHRLVQVALFSPAITALRAIRAVFSTGFDWRPVAKLCMNGLRNYFNKPLVRAIVRRHTPGVRLYSSQVLRYCRDGHLQAVLDEYAYLMRRVLQRDDVGELAGHLSRAMGMWSGSPQLNERSRGGGFKVRPAIVRTHFALAFGDDVVSEASDEGGKSRKSEVREAFNSPFWPFVLATTSVGQEGLDFHLYCGDVVHWNLPSNPVDLEQREGRINRYDGISIRGAVASELGMEALHNCGRAGGNVWDAAFAVTVARSADAPSGDGALCGLHPHWVYRPVEQAAGVTAATSGAQIRRHVLMYSGSRDVENYKRLKAELSLYRLAFGQPRQHDLVELLTARTQAADAAHVERALRRCSLNLSPVTPAELAPTGVGMSLPCNTEGELGEKEL